MVTMRVEHIGLGWDFNKKGGVFSKYPEPWLNATRPLFGMKRGCASKQEQVLINLIVVSLLLTLS